MGQLRVEEQAVIAAPADDIYQVFVDYHHHHPRILPPQYFKDIEVEQGGVGAGTVVRVTTRALGQERVLTLHVEEPEPGRLLVETDPNTGMKTSFILTPQNGDRATQVVIRTEWEPAGGLAGLVDRFVTPPVMRRMYRAELAQLAGYMATRPLESGGQNVGAQ